MKRTILYCSFGLGILGCGSQHTGVLTTLPGGSNVADSGASPLSPSEVPSSAGAGIPGASAGCRATSSCAIPEVGTPTQFVTTSNGSFSIETAKTWSATLPINQLLRGMTVDANGIYLYEAACITKSIERWYVYEQKNGQASFSKVCDLLSPSTFSTDQHAGLAVDSSNFYLGSSLPGYSGGDYLYKYSRANCLLSDSLTLSGSTIYDSRAGKYGLFNIGFDQGMLYFPSDSNSGGFSPLKRLNPVTGSVTKLLSSITLGSQQFSAGSGNYSRPQTAPFTVYQGVSWGIDVDNGKLWKFNANGYPYAWADFPVSYYPDMGNVLGVYMQNDSELIVSTCANCIDYTTERTIKFYYFDVSRF